MEIIDELLKVSEALDASGVSYAIAGGLAVAIHGCPRLTVDIDLVVPAAEMPAAVRAAAKAGFDVETGWVSLSESGLGSDRLFRVTKMDGSEFLTLDLLEVDSTDNAIWRDQTQVEIAGHSVRALSRESLIQMKAHSSRTKDKLDIEMLSDEPRTD